MQNLVELGVAIQSLSARRRSCGCVPMADEIKPPEDGTGTAAAPDAAAAPIRRPRKKVVRPKLTPDVLFGESGIPLLVDFMKKKFPGVPVPGKENRSLASLVGLYEKWASALVPGLAFADFIERAEKLGGNRFVVRAVDAVRDGRSGAEITQHARMATALDEEEEGVKDDEARAAVGEGAPAVGGEYDGLGDDFFNDVVLDGMAGAADREARSPSIPSRQDSRAASPASLASGLSDDGWMLPPARSSPPARKRPAESPPPRRSSSMGRGEDELEESAIVRSGPVTTESSGKRRLVRVGGPDAAEDVDSAADADDMVADSLEALDSGALELDPVGHTGPLRKPRRVVDDDDDDE